MEDKIVKDNYGEIKNWPGVVMGSVGPVILGHRRLKQEDHKFRPVWARISKYQTTNKIKTNKIKNSCSWCAALW